MNLPKPKEMTGESMIIHLKWILVLY
jgi:hypothetical protein